MTGSRLVLPPDTSVECWPIASDRVRYVGEPVAVVAVDRYVAEAAALPADNPDACPFALHVNCHAVAFQLLRPDGAGRAMTVTSRWAVRAYGKENVPPIFQRRGQRSEATARMQG